MSCGYRPGRKVVTVLAGLLAGADCIDDLAILRAAATGRILPTTPMAPSTVGTWLRSLTFGHVRQLDRLSYFRYGASKRTFSYLGHYAWWRMIRWLRRKHLRLGWKQLRRRYFAADAISEDGIVLYNPQAMTVKRYRFRGAQIVTPYNVDEVDPTKARFRKTNHDDPGFVGHVSEQLTLHLA